MFSIINGICRHESVTYFKVRHKSVTQRSRSILLFLVAYAMKGFLGPLAERFHFGTIRSR